MQTNELLELVKKEYEVNPRFRKKDFAAKIGVDYNYLLHLCRNNGFAYKDYVMDENFFEKINNEEKAYWLGFLYADGCMTNRGGVNLLLSTEDYDHLEKYKKALKTDRPIENRVDRSTQHKSGFQRCSKLRITNKKFYDDLEKLGCVRLKTLILKFPTKEQIPANLLRHFIRGYFDGDGSIWLQKNKTSGETLGFSITTTSDMIKGLLGEFKNAGCKKIYVNDHPTSGCRGIQIIRIRNNDDIVRLYHYMYDNSTIFMDRKKKKFDDFGMEIKNGDDILLEKIKNKYSDSIFTSLELKETIDLSFSFIQAHLRSLLDKNLIEICGNKGMLLFYKLVK